MRKECLAFLVVRLVLPKKYVGLPLGSTWSWALEAHKARMDAFKNRTYVRVGNGRYTMLWDDNVVETLLSKIYFQVCLH